MISVEKTESTEPRILRGHIQKITMRGTPLLKQGATTTPLATCENLRISAKVYSEGGENAFHSHSSDDHAFFVLAGAARFYDGDGNTTDVGPLEGMVIPRGAVYRFQSVPPDNLVILRMEGAAEDFYTRQAKGLRVAPDGTPLGGKDPRNGTPALQVVESGEFFAGA